RWHQGGITRLGTNTDAPVVPQEELTNQAALAVWLGWKPYNALRGLTIVGAEAAMVEDRVGSIEVGKDADFCIWTGNPIDPTSWVRMTVIDGKLVYDAERDGRRF
ncbi:MAG: amidohydrolase family protein, partial [Phycisphaerales bacterium]